VTCRLVGVQTYSAMRDFVFQVADTAAFEAQIYLLAKQHRGPSAIELRTLSSWTFFEEKIVPDAEQREWMRNMNVIFALGESGSVDGAQVLRRFGDQCGSPPSSTVG
jgi:hypothetical protein